MTNLKADTKKILTHIEKKLYSDVKKLAEKNHFSVNLMINVLLREAIKNERNKIS